MTVEQLKGANKALRAELAEARDAIRKIRLYQRHREDSAEVCYSWCPLCQADAAISRIDKAL